MVFALPEILVRLRPRAKWKIFDIHDYESIEWNDTSQTKPSKEECDAKLQELIDAQPWNELREERNKRLSQCDWVTLKAYSTGVPVSEEWKTYMQALRDLPANTKDPTNVTWPHEPMN